jgi:hypothetical protein
MRSVKEIRLAVEALDEDGLAEFRAWAEEFLAREWDDQIEGDSKDGRLDAMVEQAKADHANGRSRPL